MDVGYESDLNDLNNETVKPKEKADPRNESMLYILTTTPLFDTKHMGLISTLEEIINLDSDSEEEAQNDYYTREDKEKETKEKEKEEQRKRKGKEAEISDDEEDSEREHVVTKTEINSDEDAEKERSTIKTKRKKERDNGAPYLILEDNGVGMSPIQLHKMLSFGHCDKENMSDVELIGRYGNGFKSGS